MSGLQRLWQGFKDALGDLERGLEQALGPDVERPYPNEHACRLRDPDDFEDDSFVRTTRKHEGKKYSVIQARLTGEDTLTDQAFRYDKETWTASEARVHCTDHKGSFTAATSERAITEVESWSGSASNYDSTEDYCAACLIDVNAAAGRTGKAQSHCMLPVKPAGSDNYADKAIHAAAGGHGISQVKRPDDVPEDDWTAAVKKAANKLISLYGEMDEEAPDSLYEAAGKEAPERALSIPAIYGQIQEALWNWEGEPQAFPPGAMPWLNDIYVDGDQLIAIISAGGKLYRAVVALDGTTVTLGSVQEVEIEFAPVRSRALSVFRQADGRYRWVARACTAALNRVGEIDSRALFDSFVENAPVEGYPQLRFFHDPRLLMGQGDYLARDDAVFIGSGLLDDGPLAMAFVDACEKGRGAWGTSDGFTATQPPEQWEVAEGVTIPVYQAGVLREISVVPESVAAAWFTAIDVEVRRMRKEVLDGLVELFGDEEQARTFVEAFAEDVDGANRAIREAGLVTRDGAQDQDAASDPPVEPAVLAAPAEPAEIVLDDEALDAIAEKVKAAVPAVDLGPLQAALAGIEARLAAIEGATETRQALTAVDTRLKALERTDDEKREQWKADQPARKQLVVTHRPREERAAVGEGNKVPLTQVAEATLAKFPK